MQPLDPLQLPLQQQILIEASAGTGKTYTIGLLFLRLLLERELSIDQILVVTFTKAATEELRARVRQRIRDSLDILSGKAAKDDLLRQLLTGVEDTNRSAILLADALTRMDKAAIFTIHSFCQRMLQEHAFESGTPFELEFLETEQVLHKEIIEDFWRLKLYNASMEETAWARSVFTTPRTLLEHLGGHLHRPEVQYLPTITADQVVQKEKALRPLFVKARAIWQTHHNEIITILRENTRLSRDKNKGYGAVRLERAYQETNHFFDTNDMPLVADALLGLFTSNTINDSLKKTGKADPPQHPFFTLFDQFFQAHQEMNWHRKIAMVLAARSYLHQELSLRKEQQGQLYFDDLLTRLDHALQQSGGRLLAQNISKRFPAILVDEFQDTDPLQYRIFSTVHRAGSGSGLFLIGDPKQAIYGFRGADIFTYLKARRDTDRANRLTMTTNYRSTASMVASVNRFFARENAFLLGQKDMNFVPVRASGLVDNQSLLLNGRPAAACTCLLFAENKNGKPLAKNRASKDAAKRCAHEIAELLAAGLRDRAKIGGRSVTAGDIAVLVRTHNEAISIRIALQSLGITSVLHSQESVLISKEAEQLCCVLTALSELHDSGLVRAALSTDLFGFQATQLDRLNTDENQWEAIMVTLTDYRQQWQQHGFIPMFHQLLSGQQVVARLHATPGGERSLTNFLHLAELIQEAAQNQHGTEGVLHWLQQQIQAPPPQVENQQLRLESDEHLVNIVTIHKAKGLEYPVVFLPFLWASRTCNQLKPFEFHHQDNPDQLYIDLGTGNAEYFRLAEQERLAGDLRLLYVAMTRARSCSYFCWGRVNKMEESALCYLLHNSKMPAPDTMMMDLKQLQGEEESLLIKPWPKTFSPPEPVTTQKDLTLVPAQFTGYIDTSWQISSYSRLTSGHERQPERPDHDWNADKTTQTVGLDRFSFPKGTTAGTCLHAIFEQINFHAPTNLHQVVETQLLRAGFTRDWTPIVAAWVQDVLQTDIQPGCSLSTLENDNRINEMAFYFPLQSFHLRHFNKVLTSFAIPPLPEKSEILQGLMVGYIDLVYRHAGRYGIVDYKSNHLGNTAADYQQDKLQDAMLSHRYDLQYLIYSLALHRFLAYRMKDYQFDRHFGGIRYLFLRGMHPHHEPGTGIFSARPCRDLIEQLDRCCAGKEEK